MARPESKGRERALLSAYAREMNGALGDSLFEADDEISKESEEFFRILFDGMLEKQMDIDAKISKYLRNWTIDRLRAIDRCILRLAIFEMLYYKKTPIRVIFDEYIELAKKYGDSDSKNFINAVLDSINKEAG